MKLVEFNGHTIKPDKDAKFLGIIISDDLSGDQYIMHDEEKSLLSYLNRKLGALKQISKYCTVDQMLLLANGMIISKITYCLQALADCKQLFKDKIQDILTEMYRVVYEDYNSSVRQLFQKAKAFTFQSWISYLDFMFGKNIMDFSKPVYIANKIGMVQLTDQMVRRNTRSMAQGRIQYNEFNTSSYTACWKTYIPRFTRIFNSFIAGADSIITSTNMRQGKWYKIKEMKETVKFHIRSKQTY